MMLNNRFIYEADSSIGSYDCPNILIKGNNKEILPELIKEYGGKVKCIYIDPPYNNGDSYHYYDDNIAETNWLRDIHNVLIYLKMLMSKDGSVWISIDDREMAYLKVEADKVFGRENFAGTIVWQQRKTRENRALFSYNHEYILVYAKDIKKFKKSRNLLPVDSDFIDNKYKNPDNDPRGPWKAVDYLNQATTAQRPNLCYDIVNPNTGQVIHNREKAWKYEKETTERFIAENRIWWGVNGTNTVPALKRFLSEVRDGMTPHNWWPYEDVGHTQDATKEVEGLFGAKVFSFPKPVKLLKRVLQLAASDDAIVMDFFSGSATTAHAVIERNSELCENLKFILVQLPEATPDNSVARREGYDTICELGEQRIRLAGAKIVAEVEEANRQLKLGEEPKPVPDVGFRVLRIDSSNFTDTYATPDGYAQDQLHLFEDNVKPDRSDLDLLFQVLPTLRIPYSATIEEIEVCGKRTFDVNHGQLVACFDVEVGADCIEQIAKMRPIYAVFRDASMADDATEANFEELFKTFSPDTVRKVI